VTFTACPHPDVVLNIGAMRKLVDLARENPAALAIVDARPAAQFDGTEPGPEVKAPATSPSR
jgi:3-mercaptopyruvate sulfurtransferase SseA